jgi:DNA-binding NarL/FixJ family response regulator
MRQASIILADEDILLRKFLKMNIQTDPNLFIVKEAGDGLELLGQLEETPPDIVTLDIAMPNLSGLEAAGIIRKKYPLVKIVILTRHYEHNYFHQALGIGVDGYVLKNEIECFHFIINIVLQGETYISSYLEGKIES